MDLSIFKDKKIMFYGPGNTSDKDTLDISYFDYIIITNNMVELFFNKYGEEYNAGRIDYQSNMMDKLDPQSI